MAHDRDVAAFDRRATSYDEGWRGRMHDGIIMRTVAQALDAAPAPARVLDVGCGTGTALRLLAVRLPETHALVGVDAAPGMVDVARTRTQGDDRIEIHQGTAEALPIDPGTFDLVISITSFDHWADQLEGLRSCAQALTGDGVLVLTDLFSPLLAPTMIASRRGHARTIRAATRLLREAGLTPRHWARGPLLSTVIATHST